MSALAERVNLLPWFHRIDLGELVTPGVANIEWMQAQADVYFRDGIAGKTVLDVGCWDGFNSFEAERRGATVLATDHFAWTKPCWGERASLELAREVLGSQIQVKDIAVDDLHPETVGMHDIVLFLGVFYHLRNPILGFERAASVCRETIIVETHLDAVEVERPAMIFYPARECNNDPTSWWGPNVACVTEIMKGAGFHVEQVPHPVHANRGVFFGRR